jgi:hypothetical protein
LDADERRLSGYKIKKPKEKYLKLSSMYMTTLAMDCLKINGDFRNSLSALICENLRPISASYENGGYS